MSDHPTCITPFFTNQFYRLNMLLFQPCPTVQFSSLSLAYISLYLYYIGVAFEQGTLLTTPETVPFRLSRDIIDGMGICGIEGTFRKYRYKLYLFLLFLNYLKLL